MKWQKKNIHNIYNFLHYFYPEAKKFINKGQKPKIENDLEKYTPEEFESNRKIGENDLKICQLIREDSIDEFIIFLNQTSIDHSTTIKQSIFETHPYLISKELNLIEYACFCGSIRIFSYLAFDKDYIHMEWTGNVMRKYLTLSIYSLNSELICIN